ncbi:MAG: methylenetetrahydrofolate reductase C-terminal domain-containing protein [Methanophagales archaeon]|nr:methylenetetrahydrofolate reductase C-terminal domain-containing protein [Methanophagales archaeon]MCW3141149.1 methylenetetrahydrofolate reductase C-terminal domain-containing protein [Methanophagales archaeon]
MIAQEQKPMEEILGYLEGKQKVVTMGCGGCATFYGTGDKKAVKEMAEKLTKEGKEVTKIILPLGISACEIDMSSAFLEKNRKAIENCDAVLVMSCGDGVQVVTEYIDNKMGLAKSIYPANDALGLVGGGPTKFKETCQSCGMCELGKTAGICPLTSCGKGLMNGPCGGVRVDNKCEIDEEKDCAWVKIYERMEKLGELDKFIEMRDPHEWSKMKRPRLFEIEKPISPVGAMLGSLPAYLPLLRKPKLEE